MPIEKESPEEKGYASVLYNLAESSVTDLHFGALDLSLDQLKLEYVAHRGHTGLRKMLAMEAGLKDEAGVLLTNGAAAALFIVNTSLLDKEDHLVVIRPNYATNIEVPLAIGCAITYIDLTMEKSWRIDLAAVAAAMQHNTRLISVTSPHNPTGMLMTKEELNQLAVIAENNNARLLVDETYRDTCFLTTYPVQAGQHKNVISVSSLSKAFGLPGLRIGWIIAQDETLQETFLAAKEMIHISNSALDEEVAFQFYLQKKKFAAIINQNAQENFKVLRAWLEKENRLEAVFPEGGVVCFPRFKKNITVNTGLFYQVLQEKYKTMVGPGHWFDMPDTYMRIGFGWTDKAGLARGLENITYAIDAAID